MVPYPRHTYRYGMSGFDGHERTICSSQRQSGLCCSLPRLCELVSLSRTNPRPEQKSGKRVAPGPPAAPRSRRWVRWSGGGRGFGHRYRVETLRAAEGRFPPPKRVLLRALRGHTMGLCDRHSAVQPVRAGGWTGLVGYSHGACPSPTHYTAKEAPFFLM